MSEGVSEANCQERRDHITIALTGAVKRIEHALETQRQETRGDLSTFAAKAEKSLRHIERTHTDLVQRLAAAETRVEVHEDIDHSKPERPCADLTVHTGRHFALTLAVIGSIVSALIALAVASILGLAKLGVL